MNSDDIRSALRFYFITDDGVHGFSPVEQVRVAIEAGATMIQYRNKSFQLDAFDEVEAVLQLCRDSQVPLMINDNVLLARAIGADGVLICGCLVGKCESLDGDTEVLARIHQPKTMMMEMGLEPGRLRREWVCAPDCDNIRGIIAEFVEQIRKLGPCRKRIPDLQ